MFYNILVYEIGGIRIIEMFKITNTLKKCNRAFISYATAFFIYIVTSSNFAGNCK